MTIADALPAIGHKKGQLEVRLSNQLIHLLSEQMYSSPLKAIEELVVNSYDADADYCLINVGEESGPDRFIVVFDNGAGMDFQGLQRLWHIGESPKRDQDISVKHHRKVIGKFGIGKLATYAVANQITYVTRQAGRVYHVSCDYRQFKSSPEGATADPIPLVVNEVEGGETEALKTLLAPLCDAVGVKVSDLINGKATTWTFCLLESLKEKASELKLGRLKWVLRTAMPLKSDFYVKVNGDVLVSSKAANAPIVEFKVGQLPTARLAALNDRLADDWKWTVSGDGIRSDRFPSGIFGDVMVTERSLVTGKSADLTRSHGFFVKVRGRLVNQRDELFGLHALTHQTFNFFRADVEIDDLNSEVTAPREGLEQSEKRDAAANILLELFNEARSRQNEVARAKERSEKQKREHDRTYVSERLVEHPIADTLSVYGQSDIGSDADDSWFYQAPVEMEKLPGVIDQLYTKRTRYNFEYLSFGKTERLVKFDPVSAKFSLNSDHELVVAYSDDARSRALLEDLATAEVLLEVYLREARLDPYVIGEILERRDLLLRSLSQDRVYSLEAIAQSLLDSSDDEHDLEIALVAAARALGFNAKHISKAGEPDGIARFTDYKLGESKITLEAKSSENVPQLGSLDFAGLEEHVRRHQAHGCLLVAPKYPGEKGPKKKEGEQLHSAVDSRAVDGKISCWTIDDLAAVVRSAESRHLNASDVLEIVKSKFKPIDVHAAVQDLLTRNNVQATYRDVLRILRKLGDRLPNSGRTVQHVSGALALEGSDLGDAQIKSALIEMSNASRGMLRMVEDTIVFQGDLDEFERRISGLTGLPGTPRRAGTFRESDPS
jgi:hypothetical protein